MHITVKLVLQVSDCLEHELTCYERAMKHEIYRIAGVFKKRKKSFEFRYRYISNKVSWYCKGIVITQAKLLFENEKANRKRKLDFSSIWSELSYIFDPNGDLLLELGVEQGKRKLHVPFYVHEQQIRRIQQGKCKEMVIKKRGSNWFAFILVEIKEHIKKGDILMGIDIGIKNPAVAYTSSGIVKFFGNGREIRYYQRRYRKKIQLMQRRHEYKKLHNFEHKLSHILNNFDHRISKQIIDFAKLHHVNVIKLERLTNINKQFNIDLTKDIYLWSYRRLQTFIAYKANLAGIDICYVNAYNTSKSCPICCKINKPYDRVYKCICGFHGHRDLVGARNIMHAL